ncbi:MAG TPA: multicopper oxidase family protein [Methylocella sp.]|nr:multicopper oxidase family protein [Methylocella sp.]
MALQRLSRRLFIGNALALILPLPARAEPGVAADGYVTLEAREGRLRLLPEPSAEMAVWGYNGEVPGPLLRYKRGEEMRVRLVNRLTQPTSLNWHGVRIDNAMDGVAGLTQEPVEPGGSFDYRFTPPDSGFFWYRPQVLPYAREQQGRGLFGPLIIDEEAPPETDGDMLFILADWSLDDKGKIAAFASSDGDRLGELITANASSTPQEKTLPPSARVRLRVLNAADTRLMVLRFDGLTPLILAVDGQACEAFEPVRRTIPVGPGARFDVMLDLPVDSEEEAGIILLGTDEPDRPLLKLHTAGQRRPLRPPISSLPENPLLPGKIKLEAAHRASVVIEAAATPPLGPIEDSSTAWRLNGIARTGFPAAPLFSVKRGTPVAITIVNRTAALQEMRVHGHVIRLLHDLDDGWDPYWRDSVLLSPGKTKHIAFVASNPGKWALESAIAGRQALGLATWFEIT